MKTSALTIISFTFLLFSSCKKLTYPENNGVKIKKKDFNKTINGIWQIEKVWFACSWADTTCNHPPVDSGAIYISKFGEKGTLTIDYGKSFEINWHGNTLKYDFFENNEGHFKVGNKLYEKIVDPNSIMSSIDNASWYINFDIEKLMSAELKINSSLFMTIELNK